MYSVTICETQQRAAFSATSGFIRGFVLASALASDWISSGTSLAWTSLDWEFAIYHSVTGIDSWKLPDCESVR